MAQQSAFDEGLRELGLTEIPVPMWGIATVIAGPDFYEPDDGGTLAAIVPAFERSGLVDLVACSFVSRELRTRKGIALVLGHEWIERAVNDMDALTVFARLEQADVLRLAPVTGSRRGGQRVRRWDVNSALRQGMGR